MERGSLGEKIISLWASSFHSFTHQVFRGQQAGTEVGCQGHCGE